MSGSPARRERATYLGCAYAMVVLFLAATFTAATVAHAGLAAAAFGWLACGCVLIIPAEVSGPQDAARSAERG